MQGDVHSMPVLEEGGATPDITDAQMVDVALVWQSCERERLTQQRARTSVTSLRSSGQDLKNFHHATRDRIPKLESRPCAMS